MAKRKTTNQLIDELINRYSQDNEIRKINFKLELECLVLTAKLEKLNKKNEMPTL